jgi:hypothetical protein
MHPVGVRGQFQEGKKKNRGWRGWEGRLAAKRHEKSARTVLGEELSQRREGAEGDARSQKGIRILDFPVGLESIEYGKDGRAVSWKRKD